MYKLEDFKIEFSNENTSSDVIYDLMKIEADVYEKKDRGRYENIERRFCRNKEMFILLYYQETIVGSLCYFPISKELHDMIISANGFYDDNIKEKDVEKFGSENYIYLISIALYKKYQGIGLGKKMMDAFFKDLKERNKKGEHTIDILTSAVSIQGESIMTEYGFELLKDMSEKEGYKLMCLKGSNL